MAKKKLYMLLMFVSITFVCYGGIVQAATERVNEEILNGDIKIFQNTEDISLERASLILHDFIKQAEQGDLTSVSDNPYIELLGYSSQSSINLYRVKRGDTLYEIANRFNTSVDELKRINNLFSDSLYIGQELKLPASESEMVYYVRAGDSLFKLASEYDTTIKRIKEMNGLKDNYLNVGQRLLLPIKNVEKYYTYSVKAGDSLYKISLDFNISIQEIKRINNLNTNHLYVGQKLSIPINTDEDANGERIVVNDEEMDLMARAVYSEARGEPYNGQVAVAAVIINRVLHPLFPNGVEGVIFQPWQFTAVHDGQFWLDPNLLSYQAAQAALDGWDPTGGAIYYYNPVTATSDWVFHREVIIKIGRHIFAI